MKKLIFSLSLIVCLYFKSAGQISTPGGSSSIINSNPTPLGLLNVDGSSTYQTFPSLRAFSTGNEPGLNYTPATNFVEFRLNRIPWLGGSPILDPTFTINNFGDASFGMPALNFTRLSVQGNFFVGLTSSSGVRFTENTFTFSNSNSQEYVFRGTTHLFNSAPINLFKLRNNRKATIYGQLGIDIDPDLFKLEVAGTIGVHESIKVGKNPNAPFTWFPNNANSGDFRNWGNGFGFHRGIYAEASASADVISTPIGIEAISYSTCKDKSLEAYGVKGLAVNANVNYGVYGSTPSDAEICATGRFNYAIYGDGIDQGYGSYYAGYFNGDVLVTGSFFNSSDRKLKKNIEPISDEATSFIKKLNPVKYEYNNEEVKFSNMQLPKGTNYGFIAQELKSVLPELVHESFHPAKYAKDGELITEPVDYLAVNYVGLIPILTKAIQEQDDKIADLTQKLSVLNDIIQQKVVGLTTLTSQNSANENGPSFAIYPNPSLELTYLKIYNLKSYSYEIQITDSYGKKIKSIQRTSGDSSLIEINLTDFPTGTYFVSLVQNGSIMHVEKLIRL